MSTTSAVLEALVGATVPERLTALFDDPPPELDGRLLTIDGDTDAHPHLAWALGLLRCRRELPPFGLLPLLQLDDSSFACVVCAPSSSLPTAAVNGSVVRCHVLDVPERHQASLLDVDALMFVESMAEELGARGPGIDKIREIGAEFTQRFLDRDAVPKGTDLRPVRLACQNVVVGLAAFRHDTAREALVVPAWQTCEVAHVATHEGTRALAAVTLCDAFQKGGTMEIDFAPHPEAGVPASLRRYARTRGVMLGEEDPARITPSEARELFWGVTAMPAELSDRALRFCEASATSPERLCYLLMDGVWTAAELDFLLATSAHAPSILHGGSGVADGIAHQAELASIREALLVGLVHRVVSHPPRGDDESDLVEDDRNAVRWQVEGATRTVRFEADHAISWPWGARDEGLKTTFAVAPRSYLTGAGEGGDGPLDDHTWALIPADAEEVAGPTRVLRAPADRRWLDDQALSRLQKARVGRR